jgi:type II secretory pathway component HofQ
LGRLTGQTSSILKKLLGPKIHITVTPPKKKKKSPKRKALQFYLFIIKKKNRHILRGEKKREKVAIFI